MIRRDPPRRLAHLLAVAGLVRDRGLAYSDLRRLLQDHEALLPRTAERHIAAAIKAGLITRGSDRLYRQTAKYRHAAADGMA